MPHHKIEYKAMIDALACTCYNQTVILKKPNTRQAEGQPMPRDSYGRDIHYLRISLTDKCNLRCVYCMSEDMVFRPNDELMTTAEVLRLVNLFARLGID